MGRSRFAERKWPKLDADSMEASSGEGLPCRDLRRRKGPLGTSSREINSWLSFAGLPSPRNVHVVAFKRIRAVKPEHEDECNMPKKGDIYALIA